MSESAADWSGVIGHEWAIHLLQGALERGRLGHAYLFTGPAHIGKTVLARTFAQAMNCEHPEVAPCRECRPCRLIQNGGHPDVRLIEPRLSSSGRSESIKIEQIRELQKELALSPYEGRYRVAILTRFESATIGAANALLKTLEEPPDRVKLLLTAESPDALLPTIVSRCQRLSLRPLPLEELEAALITRQQADAGQARQLAHLAEGRAGLALKWLEHPAELEKRGEQLDLLESLLHADRTARFKLADKLAYQKGGPGVRETLILWLGWWRDVMLAAGGSELKLPFTNVDRLNTIRTAATRHGLDAAAGAVRSIQTTLQQLDCNANQRLALEVLLLNLPGLH